jgi:predicted nucleic acid-binding Zn ribbon protein
MKRLPRGPEKIGDILAQLMAGRGLARVQSASAADSAWRQAAGEMVSKYSRVGAVRNGRMEVIVAHSALVQELGFQKAALLATLARLLPDEPIRDLRFRVGTIARETRNEK